MRGAREGTAGSSCSHAAHTEIDYFKPTTGLTRRRPVGTAPRKASQDCAEAGSAVSEVGQKLLRDGFGSQYSRRASKDQLLCHSFFTAAPVCCGTCQVAISPAGVQLVVTQGCRNSEPARPCLRATHQNNLAAQHRPRRCGTHSTRLEKKKLQPLQVSRFILVDPCVALYGTTWCSAHSNSAMDHGQV